MSLAAVPDALIGAAGDLARLQTAWVQASAAAPLTGLAAAAGDEVSAAIAGLFGAYGRQYQALSVQAARYHDQFVRTLNGSAMAYAGAEAANASPLQLLEQQMLGVINAPTQAVLGRPLIGNGANGTAANPNGGAGGLLYGNGGNGYNQTAAGMAGGAGGAAGLIGNGGLGGVG
ncbi:PE family protein, partial [Mycobacterium szulgai]